MPHASPVIYQIFPERFAIGSAALPAQKLQQKAYRQPDFETRSWDAPLLADSAAHHGTCNPGKVFYGGDLQGVSENLDYLKDLGVTTIYLTPLFEAPSNHKYDAVTFDRIDPMFGGEARLAELIKLASYNEMGIIMDAAFNHVSNHHPWFVAAQHGEAPYPGWFTLKDDQYECWWGFGHMPELNLARSDVAAKLIKVVRRFLEMGIQGWRFDTGQDIGLPFVARLRDAVRDYPQAALLGELMNYAADWIGPQAFTGVMNYYQRTTLLAWLDGRIASRQAHIALREGYEGHGHAGSLASWNMLASHDTPRLKHLLPDWRDRQLTLVAQFTLPGIPVIYYGEENGMDGAGDPDCRRPMQWDEQQWDQDTRRFYKTLIELRKNHPALGEGRMTVIGDRLDHSEALIYLRQTGQPGESVIVVLHRGQDDLDAHLMLPDSHLYSTVVLQDALGNGMPINVDGGLIRVRVPGRSAAIYLPQEPVPQYRYFKHRNRI